MSTASVHVPTPSSPELKAQSKDDEPTFEPSVEVATSTQDTDDTSQTLDADNATIRGVSRISMEREICESVIAEVVESQLTLCTKGKQIDQVENELQPSYKESFEVTMTLDDSQSSSNLVVEEPKQEQSEQSYGMTVKHEPMDGESNQATPMYYTSSKDVKDELPDDSDSGSSLDNTDSDSDSDYFDNEEKSESDHEVDQHETEQSTEKEKKPRQAAAKNAREFIARLHKIEDEKEEKKKRKNKGNTNDPRKSRKLDDGIRRLNDGANIALGCDNMESCMADDSAPEMESIRARTHAGQFAKIMAGVPQDYDTRHTSTQMKDLRIAAKIFGNKKVIAKDGGWRLKGMITYLQGHQFLAVSWMVLRELARCEPYGGILADGMGMGKTVMSLACIVGNPPEKEDIKQLSKATLVVVPSLAIARQWKDEVKKHCGEKVSGWVTIYSAKEPLTTMQYRRQWVVITTYPEVLKQFQKLPVTVVDETKDGSSSKRCRNKKRDKRSILFQIQWYRIILDEAHKIKDLSTETTAACCELDGRFRWALSGTPLSNSSQELFPYLKYLRCQHTKTRKGFNSKYLTDGVTNDSFQVLVSSIMLRRTRKDTFMGRKILSIPDSQTDDLSVSLSPEEMVLFQTVSDYYDDEIDLAKNDKLKEDVEREEEPAAREGVRLTGSENSENTESPNKPQAKALSISKQMVLRRAISHPFCIENTLRQKFDQDSINSLNEKLTEVSAKDGRTLLDHLSEAEEMTKYQVGINILKEQKEACFGGRFSMKAILDRIANEYRVKRLTCPLCNKGGQIVDPVCSSGCGHPYCSICLCRVVKAAERSLPFDGPVDLSCRYEACGKQLQMGEDIPTLYWQTEEARLDDKIQSVAKDSIGVNIPQEAERKGCFTAASVTKTNLLPSTKLTVAMAVILTWLREAPDDKIIVFSQFIPTMIELGRMLRMLGIGFVYYCGRTSAKRSQTLEAFKENRSVKIFVSTLQSGGQSLNLTVANRVIMLDPWWNKTQEQQALGRVTRLGQEKKSFYVRIGTKDSIDEAIYDMQDKKAQDIDRALQDDGYTPESLDEAELRHAFEEDESDGEEEKKKAMKSRESKRAAKEAAKTSKKSK